MVSVVKMIMVAGGIWKRGARWRSMVRACWMAKVKLCDPAAMAVMLAAHSGSMRTMDLSSSTRCTVDTRHRFGSPEPAMSPAVTIAARSKNLHLVGVEQPPVGGDGGVQLLVVVELAGVVRHGLLDLLERGDDDLHKPLEGAPFGLHLHVERVPDDEGQHGDEHGDGRDPEPPPPPHGLLDVHHHRQGEQHGEPHAEEVEVEVAPLLLAAGAPTAEAELVGAERHHARPDAAGPERGAEQRQVQHGELPAVRALARGRGAAAAARRGAEGRDESGHDEAEHADLVQHAAAGDGPEAAGEGVGGDRAQHRGERRRAGEVGEEVRGLHQRQVQLLCQVRDHVRVESGRGEPVAHLVR
ncbi:hypothetical protein EE612_029460, partial [Oryza sativa]